MNKKLLGSVLGIPIDTVFVSNDIVFYGNGLTTLAQINIYKLVFLIKEWTYNQGFPIISGRSIRGKYIANVMTKPMTLDNHFNGISENEAVIKAGKWVVYQCD